MRKTQNKKKHFRKTRSKKRRENKRKHTKVFGGRCALPRPLFDRINEIRDNNGFADDALQDVPEDFDINEEVQEIHRRYNSFSDFIRELMNTNIRLDRTTFRIFTYTAVLIYLINSICYNNRMNQYRGRQNLFENSIDNWDTMIDDISRWDTSDHSLMGNMGTEPFN